VLHPANGIAAAVILLGSVSLHEWVRRTIRERRFHIAWSGEGRLIASAAAQHLGNPP
jgi:hypothetical protein